MEPSYKNISYLHSDEKQNSNSSNRGNRDSANINELFNCYICFGKVKNAVMCPQCSKLCCEQCIKVYLFTSQNV